MASLLSKRELNSAMCSTSTSQTAIMRARSAARIATALPCEYAPRLPPMPIAATVSWLFTFAARARDAADENGTEAIAPATAERCKNSRRLDRMEWLLVDEVESQESRVESQN